MGCCSYAVGFISITLTGAELRPMLAPRVCWLRMDWITRMRYPWPVSVGILYLFADNPAKAANNRAQ